MTKRMCKCPTVRSALPPPPPPGFLGHSCGWWWTKELKCGSDPSPQGPKVLDHSSQDVMAETVLFLPGGGVEALRDGGCMPLSKPR
jgi:hypothetical protein